MMINNPWVRLWRFELKYECINDWVAGGNMIKKVGLV